MIKKSRMFVSCILVLALVPVISLVISPITAGAEVAEDSWIQNPANGHFYRLTDPMSWLTAEAQAVEWRGHLVTINDSAENLWLVEQFYPLDLRVGYWIGFNDIETEGNWVWSSGEMPGYENWCPGEPNDVDGEDAANMEGYPYDDPEIYCWNDNPDRFSRRAIVEKISILSVYIDIKPGSDPNSINCNNENGVIAVAILTTDDFDATTVDHTTVTFEGASEIHVNKNTGEPLSHEEDVDLDGDIDLVFHFRIGDTILTCDSTMGRLTGETYDGISIQGTDSIRIVP